MWHLHSKMVKHSPSAPDHPSLQPFMPRLSGSKVCAAVLGRDARTVARRLSARDFELPCAESPHDSSDEDNPGWTVICPHTAAGR